MCGTMYWQKQKMYANQRDPCSRNHDDEKSNNLQNEENLRRYTNPLKEESGSVAEVSSRVSVVRPLSTSSNDVLEMMCDEKPSSSQILLYKSQNSCSDANINKEFDCKRINLTVVTPVQRTLKEEKQNSSDVLTVLV